MSTRTLPLFAAHPHAFPGPVFRGVVQHVVDGDTYDVLLDLGFGVTTYQTIRLRGLDTPELRRGTPEARAHGQAARQAVLDLLLGQAVLVTTYKDRQTFGRYVADLTVGAAGASWDLATRLRAEGHVK